MDEIFNFADSSYAEIGYKNRTLNSQNKAKFNAICDDSKAAWKAAKSLPVAKRKEIAKKIVEKILNFL